MTSITVLCNIRFNNTSESPFLYFQHFKGTTTEGTEALRYTEKDQYL
jgi:hypothetical protein